MHKGLDLIMYLSAIGLMTYVKYSPEFDVAIKRISSKFTSFWTYGAVFNLCVSTHKIIKYSSLIK